jgi:hypothetical protein
MKKFLLFAIFAVVAFANSFAVTDSQTYADVNGIKVVNTWIFDRNHTKDAFAASPLSNSRARTAVMYGGVIYVARSEEKTVISGTDTVAQSVIHRYSAVDGSAMSELDVTLDGKPYGDFLGVNGIGVDNFGHVWVAPYTSEKTTTIPLYQLNTETGALTKIADLEKGDVIARTDYLDVMGDITAVNAECNAMVPGTGVATVYRWHCDKGGTSWDGGFSGDPYLDFTAFYPANQTQWSYCPTVRMVLGSDAETMYSGENFYVDGFNTVPTLYDTQGGIIDSFGNVDEADLKADSLLLPKAGTNGVAEFHLDSKNFVVYSIGQYDAPNSCQINVCELGEGMAFKGMKRYWTLPNDGLGQVSDAGNRVHSINVEYYTENGNDGVKLFTYKCQNGMGVYKIAKASGVNNINVNNATISVSGDVITVSAPANIEVYNLAGQVVAKAANATQVTAPAKGVYVVKAVAAGSSVVKKVVI